MPTVSRFFGIVITVNYADHPPPHFHARYAEHKAVIAIDTLVVLEGSLPPRVLGLVVEWATQHGAELAANWALAGQQAPLQPIAPLERAMLKDIVEVAPIGGCRLHVRFEDGVEGDVDIAEIVSFVGVFATLTDPSEFAKVRVDRETGTIAWPNGADIDPVVLYARITGTPVTTHVAPTVSSRR